MLFFLIFGGSDLGPLAQVQAKYGKVKSLSADFTESVTYSEGYQERFSGKMFVAEPGMIRLEASEPRRQLIVSDGKDAWLYMPEMNQALKQPVAEISKACDPAIFLLNTPEDFSVSYTPQDNGHAFTFVPPEDGGYPYQKVVITLDDQLVIKGVSVVDLAGNIYAFSLSNVVLNPKFPEDMFSFTPPPGTEVFGQ